MKASLAHFRQDLRQPWQRAVFFLTLIPLFPEYISFVLVLAAVFAAWKDQRQEHRPIVIGTIGKLLIAYILYMAVTLFYSKHFSSSLSTVGMWIFLFAVYMVLSNILTDRDRYDALMFYITAVGGAVGLIACFQYRIGFFVAGNPMQFWGWLDNLVYQFIPVQLSKTPYILRACSTYANPNVLSEYLMAIAPFVLYYNFCEKRVETRMFCRVCLFLTFGGVIFSFCRGGYLATLVLMAALIILNIRHRFAKVTLYLVSGLLLIPDEVIERFLTIIPGITTSSAVVQGATSSATPYTTTAEIINNSVADLAINDRWRIWMECLRSSTRHPIFGQGAGIQITWSALSEAGINAVHAHNIALEILMEGGVIALIIMLFIAGKVIKNGVELILNRSHESVCIGLAVVGFVATFCIQGMVDYPLMTPKLVVNFMMILAIAECSVRLYSGETIPVRQRMHDFSRRLFRRDPRQQQTTSL